MVILYPSLLCRNKQPASVTCETFKDSALAPEQLLRVGDSAGVAGISGVSLSRLYGVVVSRAVLCTGRSPVRFCHALGLRQNVP